MFIVHFTLPHFLIKFPLNQSNSFIAKEMEYIKSSSLCIYTFPVIRKYTYSIFQQNF